MIRVIYKPLRGLKPIHLATLAVLRGRDTLEAVQGRLMIPEIFVAEAVADLQAWGLIHKDDVLLRKTKQGQTCLDVWWTSGKLGYWEFHTDQSWVLGEGTFGLNSLHERLSDFGVDLETGAVLDRDQAKDEFNRLQAKTVSEEKFADQLDLLGRLVQQWISTGLAEPQETFNRIESIFLSLSSRRHVNHLYGHGVRILSEIPGAASKDEKTREVLERITAAMKRFKKEALRGSVREHESRLRVQQEVLLAAWLSGRKGLLREIAESQPRALYVHCDHGGADAPGDHALPEYVPDLDESRFGESGFLGIESL